MVKVWLSLCGNWKSFISNGLKKYSCLTSFGMSMEVLDVEIFLFHKLKKITFWCNFIIRFELSLAS
jgi:hypothetical protein